jgi:hypothetical protein
MADNHAIVVGLNHYPGIAPLEGPENDAKWFHGWLLRNALVKPENAALIVSSAFAASASAFDALPDTAAVDRAFERLLRIGVTRDKVGGRLYLFFSGHGFGPTINDAALLMANCDASIGITGHYVNAVTYADFFATGAFFDEIVLLMDCCRDDLWRAPGRTPPWQSIRNVDGGSVKRFYGLATRWARKAREAKTPEGIVHGYFTRALKAALEGGGVDKDKTLSTSRVLAFTTNYIQSVAKPELVQKGLEVPEPQFPQKDDFVIATGLSPTLTEVTIRFGAASQPSRKDFILRGGKDDVIVRNRPGDNPWTHSVVFGHYVVIGPDDSIAAEFDAFGEKVALDV